MILLKIKQSAHNISTHNYSFYNNGLFLISAVTDLDKIDALIENIMISIDDLKSKGIKIEDFKRAKQQMKVQHYSSMQNISYIASSASNGLLYFDDPEFLLKYLEMIENTTLEEVNHVLNKYLIKEKMSVVRILPEYSKSDKSVKGSEIREQQTKMVTLDNGIRVIVQRDTFIPEVAINIGCLGGIRFEIKENSGISNIMSKMLIKGTTTKTEKEITSSVENKGGNIGSYGGSDIWGLSVKVLKEDFSFALELIEDMIKHPAFKKDELNKSERKSFIRNFI